MKVRKGLKAAVIAMAAMSNVSVAEEIEIARAAVADMDAEYGQQAVIIELNPFGGMIA